MKIINQRTQQGERHGYWEYYENGNLFFKGHYDNGIMIGYWEVYHGNGNPWYKGQYHNGKLHGYWEWYYDNGKLEEQIFYS